MLSFDGFVQVIDRQLEEAPPTVETHKASLSLCWLGFAFGSFYKLMESFVTINRPLMRIKPNVASMTVPLGKMDVTTKQHSSTCSTQIPGVITPHRETPPSLHSLTFQNVLLHLDLVELVGADDDAVPREVDAAAGLRRFDLLREGRSRKVKRGLVKQQVITTGAESEVIMRDGGAGSLGEGCSHRSVREGEQSQGH